MSLVSKGQTLWPHRVHTEIVEIWKRQLTSGATLTIYCKCCHFSQRRHTYLHLIVDLHLVDVCTPYILLENLHLMVHLHLTIYLHLIVDLHLTMHLHLIAN